MKKFGTNPTAMYNKYLDYMFKKAADSGERLAIRYQAYKNSGGNFRKMQKQLTDTAYTKWKNFILPLLDTDRTFENTSDKEAFLKQAYTGLVTGVRSPYVNADKSADNAFF